MIEYGYMRTSNTEVEKTWENSALNQYGILRENLILDASDDGDFNDKVFYELLKKLQPGDVLVVESIAQLGWNGEMILRRWKYLVQEQLISIVVLNMPSLQSNGNHSMNNRLISECLLQILSDITAAEKQYVHNRQAKGIQTARDRGVQIGRHRKDKPSEYPMVLHLWESGEISACEAARRLSIDHHTFLVWAKESREKNSASPV